MLINLMSEQFFLKSPVRIVDLIGSYSDSTDLITNVAGINNATFGSLCFCESFQPDVQNDFPENAIILTTKLVVEQFPILIENNTVLIVEDPRAVFIDVGLQLLEENYVKASNKIQNLGFISSSASIGSGSVVADDVVIEDNVSIGSRCTIHRGTWIKNGAVIHDGCVIGSSGINAYKGKDSRVRKFPHFASVIIEENVEVGSNSVVVKGILNSTTIGRNTTLGNLSNIGHGVVIDENCWLSVGSLIGGHTRIGKFVTIGMGCAIKDNLEIADNCQIGMGSVVIKSLSNSSSVFGNPARPIPTLKAGPSR